MPRMSRKRSISAKIWENEAVDGLTDSALRVWIGSWSVSDRNGIFPWRPRVWTRRFASRTSEDPEAIFEQLVVAGLVEKFFSNGEVYGFSVNWAKHQDPHIDEAPVYPLPDSPNFKPCPPRHWTQRNAKWMVEVYGLTAKKDGKSTSAETGPRSGASTGGHTSVDPACPSCPSGPTDPPGRKDSSQDPGKPAPENANGVPPMVLPCVGQGAKEYVINREMLQEWSEAYPSIDCLVEARKMRLWLLSSPERCKTYQGMGRWTMAWLARAQNAPPPNKMPTPARGSSGPPPRLNRADQDYLAELKRDSGGQR